MCGEIFSRQLIDEVRSARADVLLVSAQDGFLSGDSGRDLALAVQVLRSVEYGLPSVRSSSGGDAMFVAADGTILARSHRHTPGVLTWSQEEGARDFDLMGQLIDGEKVEQSKSVEPEIAVLSSERDPEFRTLCPAGHCGYHTIEDFECTDQRSDVVIVAGHATPLESLRHELAEVAAAVACFQPRMVVIDTCFGASTPILRELSGTETLVVASARTLVGDGLRYGPEFFHNEDLERRAAAIADPDGHPLLRWWVDAEELAAIEEEAAALGPDTDDAVYVSRNPTCAQLDLHDAGPVLVPVERRRGPPVSSDRMRELQQRVRDIER